jgi:hypothetical protein
MAVGTIAEDTYLTSLPSNTTFTVIELIPEERDGWVSSIGIGKKPPYNVSQSEQIVITNLSTTKVTDTGAGPSATLKFKINFSTPDRSIEKTGYITVSSTDWPLIGRPDYSLLTFGFDQDVPQTIHKKIPYLISPDSWSIGIGIQDNKIALVAQADSKLETKLISTILQGIVTAHTDALKWVVRAL